MRNMCFTLLCLMIFVTAGAAYGQSWESGVNTGTVSIEWTFDVDTYTFNVSSPIVDDRPYQIMAWTVQPYNIPEPVEVVCPDGWEWLSKGGLNYFEIARRNEKYDVGGSALEPGETLTFRYVVGNSTTPVNTGGPVDMEPAFMFHVGAIDGVNGAGYVPYAIQLGQTWHEVTGPPEIPYVPVPVPEPSSLLMISSGFFALGCLGSRRARV